MLLKQYVLLPRLVDGEVQQEQPRQTDNQRNPKQPGEVGPLGDQTANHRSDAGKNAGDRIGQANIGGADILLAKFKDDRNAGDD